VATSMTELVPVRVPLATDLKRFLVLSFIIQPVYGIITNKSRDMII
jgi:hypothetical protein